MSCRRPSEGRMANVLQASVSLRWPCMIADAATMMSVQPSLSLSRSPILHTLDTITIMTVTTVVPEFTAVILAATTGARLFPMTSPDAPKHLMPVAGVPCVVRLLHSVAASGFTNLVVALASSDTTSMSILKEQVGEDDMFCALPEHNMKVTLVSLSDDCAGSAEALRQVNDVIPQTSNILVLPGDLVVMETSVLQQLVHAHRQANLPPHTMSTACTMLLANVGEQDEHGVPLKESSKVMFNDKHTC
jgi:CTP:molybdopterin cytidylyltransferase MocA